jgi:hypothetical protein
MGLRVVGAGFGRTGTSSLKIALERLGFSKCHHMREVPMSASQVDAWLALSRGEDANWDAVFEGFDASCDWPSSAYWERLYHYYPDCKVVLTVRDPESWYESTKETIYGVSSATPRWLGVLVPRIERHREMVHRTVWDGIFDGKFEDKEHSLRVYRQNVERVKQVVSPERLLVSDVRVETNGVPQLSARSPLVGRPAAGALSVPIAHPDIMAEPRNRRSSRARCRGARSA